MVEENPKQRNIDSMKPHLLITVGPIPAKLDSVKLITNKFKGGLAAATACALTRSHRVTIVAHETTVIPKASITDKMTILRIKDVMDCYRLLEKTQADTYVLAGAVANLMPSNPWEGKFPSHDYKVGEKFNIEFEIAPRAIDKIREWHPKATLIGYKLFDGDDTALLRAGHETLRESKAHVVFCNHPAWAKTRKIAITQDGAILHMDFASHIKFIEKTSALKWYSSEPYRHEWENPQKNRLTKLVEILGKKDGELLLGCAAIRSGNAGFVTTSRGKSSPGEHAYVGFVNERETKVHYAAGPARSQTDAKHTDRAKWKTKGRKATLNAPTLAKIFENHKSIQCILHGHKQLPDVPTFPYVFPGTTEEVAIANGCPYKENNTPPIAFNIDGHGYYAGFESIEDAEVFLKTN